MGKVIGRNGSVAKALRTLLKVTAAREGGSVRSRSSERGQAPSHGAGRASSSPRSAASTGCTAPCASRSSPTARRRASPRARCSIPRATTRPLTIVAAQPVEDGPGWRLRFREVPDRAAAERLRDAYLEIEVDRSRRPRRRAPRTGTRSSAATVRGFDGRRARRGRRHLPRRRERGLRRARRAARRVRPAGRRAT